MRNTKSQPLPNLRTPRALQAVVWIVAIGAPSFVLYNNGVREARVDAEQRVLAQVANRIQSPSTNKSDILLLLTQHEHEVSRARYFRICTRLGMKADWKSDWNALFDDVARRPKEEQAKAAKIIADECGLDPASNLKMERMSLALSRVAPTTADVLPNSLEMRSVSGGS